MKDERLMKVLLEPRVTEKSTRIGERYRQFVFKVVGDATKPEIRRAVEKMFSVEVETVRTCKVKGKIKTFRQRSGRRSGWKKAYITLKPGFDIDFVAL